MKEQLIISPRTKVLQLIEAYPELEDLMIEMVPAFSKLKNPVLRKTVARITTLQQAAAVGQVELEVLINKLREAAGQDIVVLEKSTKRTAAQRPLWVVQLPVHKELDARPMLLAGEHPVGQVLEDLKKLPSDTQYLLTAPFYPAPLIDKASSLGVEYYAEQRDQNQFLIHFRRPEDQ